MQPRAELRDEPAALVPAQVVPILSLEFSGGPVRRNQVYTALLFEWKLIEALALVLYRLPQPPGIKS